MHKKKAENHSPPPNQNNKEVYETQQPKDKQTQPGEKKREKTENNQNKREVHEKENKQAATNSGSIVIINHSDSGHDIQTMIEELLRNNDFSNDSSIFVIVPSVDKDAVNNSQLSDSQSSTICIQMSVNPLKWRKKGKPGEPDTTNAVSPQGVKISAKGKHFFMEGLPIEVLSLEKRDNKETLFGHQASETEDNLTKPTKNKLCQITTPDGIVKRPVQTSHGMSTDTTIDRPCCCANEPQFSVQYASNDRYVPNIATGINRGITAGIATGMIGQPFLLPAWTVNQNEPFMSMPCCLPDPTMVQVQECTTMPQMQLCQCTPEKFMELLQQVVKGARLQNMQSIGCGEGAKSPDAQSQSLDEPAFQGHCIPQCLNCISPPKKKEPTCTCHHMQHVPGSILQHSPQTGDGYLIELIETGKTEQKQHTSKQKRFYSTIGTSTGPKLNYRFQFGGKCKNAQCECPEPSPDPSAEVSSPSEDTVDEKNEDITKMKLILRVSGPRLNQKKQPPPEPASVEFRRKHDVRYYVLMKPELFRNMMEQPKAKKTSTHIPASVTATAAGPDISPEVTTASAAASESKDDDDETFRGLNFNITCDEGLTGVCCFDLFHESFTTW